jgi:hypothetical protein
MSDFVFARVNNATTLGIDLVTGGPVPKIFR